MLKITTVIGTRPELVKMSLLIPLLDKNFEHKFIFLGQHYSDNMVKVFFDELGIRKPDVSISVKSSDPIDMMDALEPIMKKDKSDYVLVYGDTNATYAAAKVAKWCNKKIIHVEAGLRCFDKDMPEEQNRVMIDHLADILFAPTELEKGFLLKEHIKSDIQIVGNTIVDVCNKFAPKESRDEDYILVTLHRQENVDSPEKLLEFFKIFVDLPYNIMLPLHPRTKQRLNDINSIAHKLPSNIRIIEPVGYKEFLGLLKNCSLVATDSGGVCEEAFILGKPCIVLRNNTERWHPIAYGCGFLAGCNPELIKYLCKMLYGTKTKEVWPNPYGDGQTSKYIVSYLKGLEKEVSNDKA